jgi:hypothetical protein
MLPAVKLNDQFFLETYEINDAFPDRLLSAKLPHSDLTHPKMLPKQFLRIG